MQAGHHRTEMLARLGRVLDAQHARGGHAARERIDLLLDRDSPFLELSSLDGDAVVGIGVVEATACLVVSPDGPDGDPDHPKVRRAHDLAAACRLPVVVLDDGPGDAEPVRRHRQELRWRRHPSAGPAPAVDDPPVEDADRLLDVPEPAEILRLVVDGSRIDIRHGDVESDSVTGWAAIGGLPTGVVARRSPAADPPDLGGLPVLHVTVDPVPGAAPEVALTVSGGAASLRFAWPGTDLPGRAPGHDGVIDPRDSRIVAGIARWCVEPR